MRWSYKTVRFGLKKEGLLGSAFLDESEIEFSLNEFGKAGWELVSFMEVQDGVIGVFKQPIAQGWSRLETAERRKEEAAKIEAVKEASSFIGKTADVVLEPQGRAREQVLEENLGQEWGEPDTDVGSIRIE